MPPRLVLSLREGATVETGPEGAVRATGPSGTAALGRPPAAVADALARLAREDVEPDALSAQVLEAGGALALARLLLGLDRLSDAGLLRYTLRDGDTRIATVEPLVEGYRFGARDVAPGQRFVLSRFASARRDGAHLVVESPAAPARLVLHAPRCGAVLVELAAPTSARTLAARPDALPEPQLCALLGLCLDAGLLSEVDADGAAVEPPALAAWEPHDLLFHARSRRGRHRAPYGATYRLAEAVPPPPAVTPRPPDEGLALYRPELDALLREDVPFTRVLEARRSLRTYGETPIRAEPLGELLYRAARVRGRRPGEHGLELTDRPYPGGGALYELELYLAVARCEGVPPGLHHYDPEHHRLHLVRDAGPEVSRLLADAAHAAGAQDVQVLTVLAARFARVAWKYQSMAYALVLKDAGVLMQNLCLVAEAMGLAACPLGGGDAELFSRAADRDFFTEGSVAELILGSRSPP